MSDDVRVSVLGAGNWGTTVADLIGRAGHRVRLWTRRAEIADEINEQRRNTRYLEGFELSGNIEATTDLERAVRDVPLLFFVLPSQSFREVCREASPLLQPVQHVVHATKGIERKSHKRMTEILFEETCIRQMGVLSGPNIAREICEGNPAGTVIASRFPRIIAETQEALVSERFRVYSNEDVVGVELAGALKNIIAIAAGAATQMELGENARALLITRGLSEIARLGVACGAKPMTFAGLAGIGDLMVTCASPHSRNHRLGAALARGEKLEDAIAKLGQVAEGVNTAKAAREMISERGVDAPILEGVHRMIYEDLAPTEAVRMLMAISSKYDIDRALQ